MRNKQGRHARFLQLTNHSEQRFRFIVRQGGRRLVQHNDFRLFDHGTHDGQHLELTAVEHAGRRSGINMPHVNRFKNLPGIGIQLLPVNKRTVSRKIADKQVFGNAGHENHVQFLIDHLDAAFFGIRNAGKLFMLSVNPNFTFVFLMRITAGENLHQCGLSRAVFAADGHHFALFNSNRNLFQRNDAGKAFRNVFHLQDDFAHSLISFLSCHTHAFKLRWR